MAAETVACSWLKAWLFFEKDEDSAANRRDDAEEEDVSEELSVSV